MDKNRKSKLSSQHKALSALIHEWNLIPGAPADEFDAAAHKILSALYRNVDVSEISFLLEKEIGSFSDTKSPVEIKTMVDEVIKGWGAQA